MKAFTTIIYLLIFIVCRVGSGGCKPLLPSVLWQTVNKMVRL